MDQEKTVDVNNMTDGHKSEFFNGFGGFVADGKEYQIILNDEIRPPAPWINVIANKDFGFQISETGAGMTWAVNSRENKITAWSNDPVSDKAGEAIYIKDEITGKVITPVSLGKKGGGIYRVRHGFGYSVFDHDEDNIKQELTVFAPLEESLKLWHLKLTNTSETERYLNITYYVEWVLGEDREYSSPYTVTSYNNEHEYLAAKNIYNYNFRKQVSFMFSSEMIIAYTGDRQEFLGLKGSILHPEGLHKKLPCNTGVGYDPCGAIQISIAIKPHESRSVVFGLGQSADPDEIIKLRYKYKNLTKIEDEMRKIKNYWDGLLDTIKVRTSDRAIDILLNGWLLYQTVSCRINAKSAFYQCGGAYGFRDQLQDVLSLLHADPRAVKKQIILACSRQFEEGDVQHWWHPPSGLGVRTKITDDLLWLPFVTGAYVRTTGDHSILDERVNYIKGALLEKGHHESMFIPEVSEMEASVYEHCKKTILRTGFGEHGLPFMGGGDWNDGMNMVGIEGKGESVWLGWFLYALLEDFIAIAVHRGDHDFAESQILSRENLRRSIEENAWDGEWYIRAFYDDNEKIGSKESYECKIDSISQSWSVISGAADNIRAAKAIYSAKKYLVNEKEGLSLLLTPPFDKTDKNPGYIKNYYPGMRENGGQYSHASVWLAIAASMIGDHNLSYDLFTMLNPIHISSTKRGALRYEKEPYVMVADMSSLDAPHTGRGGWSWYTGSSGWMYQGLINYLLGIKKEGLDLSIDPSTPSDFGDYTVWYKFGTSTYEIRVTGRTREDVFISELNVDGTVVAGNKIKLVDDGASHLVIAHNIPINAQLEKSFLHEAEESVEG
ncbi:MAG: hypothetical protein U2P59_04265 [Synergistota bacterium]|nr:hypothetical protein [Synergistota bacterium]